MKLAFKSPLTNKPLRDINLRTGLNWSLGRPEVHHLPNLREGHAGSGSKRNTGEDLLSCSGTCVKIEDVPLSPAVGKQGMILGAVSFYKLSRAVS